MSRVGVVHLVFESSSWRTDPFICGERIGKWTADKLLVTCAACFRSGKSTLSVSGAEERLNRV